jgi:hypothetical protein
MASIARNHLKIKRSEAVAGENKNTSYAGVFKSL